MTDDLDEPMIPSKKLRRNETVSTTNTKKLVTKNGGKVFVANSSANKSALASKVNNLGTSAFAIRQSHVKS